MKDPLKSLVEISSNISSGALISDELAKEIEKDTEVQKGKVDVFMQATTAYQTQRLARYMQAAAHLENQVLDIEFMSNLPPEDKVKLMDMLQKHSESMIKFIDSKSNQQPERVKDITVNMDNRSVIVNEDQETGLTALQSVGSAGRSNVRNILTVLEEALTEEIPGDPTEEAVTEDGKPKKVVIKKRIIKKKK
jgi:hypothetical protein